MIEDFNLPEESTTETPAETPHKSESELFDEAFFEGVERKEKPVHIPNVGDDTFGEVEFQIITEEDQQAFLETEYKKQMENHLKTFEESIQSKHGVDLDTYLNNTAEALISKGYSQEQANQIIIDDINKGFQLDKKTLEDHEILDLMKTFADDKGHAFGNRFNDHIHPSVFQEAAKKNIPLSQSYIEYRESQKAAEQKQDDEFLAGFMDDNKKPWLNRKGLRW